MVANRAWLIGSAALVAGSALLMSKWVALQRSSQSLVYASIPLEETTITTNGQYGNIAISPDGRLVAFRQPSGIFLRSLGGLTSAVVPGTVGAVMPTFSRDGKSLVFVQSGKIRKVAVAGGPVSDVAVFAASAGLEWEEDDNIYSTAGVSLGGIWRVPASGGVPVQVTHTDAAKGENAHTWPQLLPGKKALLFTALGPSGGSADSRVVAERLDSHERVTLVEKAMFGRYLPTGQLLYANNDGTVFAVSFDVARLAVTGKAEPVLSGVGTAAWGGAEFLSVAENGTAIYLPKSTAPFVILSMVDRTGREVGSPLQPGPSSASDGGPSFLDARLSPDGRRIAATGRRPGVADIWMLDSRSWSADRLTFDGVEDEYPVWSPDGKSVAYTIANAGSSRRLVIRSTSTGASPRVVRTWPRHLHINSWSRDGKWLAVLDYAPPPNGNDVWVLSAESKDSAFIAGGPGNQTTPVFSPDGRWLAYTSDETGGSEIYVIPFPPTGARTQASAHGGTTPRWDSAGRALYYLHGGKLMMQSIETAGRFTKGEESTLFATDAISFDVAPDGQHFLLVRPHHASSGLSLNLIINWFDGVRVRAASTTPRQ